MSTLINLLPDIRQAKLKERRRRQMISGIAVATWVVCGAVVLILSLVTASEKVIIGTKTNEVQAGKKSLSEQQGLVDALTAQQHLNSLKSLYGKRVYITKFFTALSQSDPSDITLGTLSVDTLNTMTISGDARSYASVAKLARALSAQNVTLNPELNNPSPSPYFTDVAITDATHSSKSGVNFTITATIGPGAISQTGGASASK